MSAVAKAWWWFLDYLWAIGAQGAGLFRRSPPRAFDRGDPALPTIVLLPGVYERWTFLAPLARALAGRGHRILVVPALRDNRMPVPDAAEAALDALIGDALTDTSTDGAPAAHLPAAPRRRYLLLAHSKGGLVGKALLLRAFSLGERLVPEVVGLVAIATPFAGSRYARRMPGRTLRGLAPEDMTIVRLAASADANAGIVSIQPRFDPHIPGERSLPGAVNVTLEGSGHFRILGSGETLDAVRRAIALLTGGSAEP